MEGSAEAPESSDEGSVEDSENFGEDEENS
jgi:hypothetical protein